MADIVIAGMQHLEAVRTLFREYQQTPGVAECVTGFAEEVAALPGPYAPPEGLILLAMEGDLAVGCAAIRLQANDACELKRLYVQAGQRGKGTGEALMRSAAEQARRLGYARMRLDTLPSMRSAIALYTSLGFQPIGQYYKSAPPNALFFELDLNR